ncbi:MAG: DNA translocase FtsK, partial [Erysipelotrichaceae bacterium]|nr:DNA translocase FtsK [Erysipelotrichaceae bacterium]
VSEQAKPFFDDAFVVLEEPCIQDGFQRAPIDPMYEEVVKFVVAEQKASTSLLQRRFGFGYNRAAKIIDMLQEEGIIGPAQGSKPREVFVKSIED